MPGQAAKQELQGRTICTSGFDQSDNHELVEKIKELGGIYKENLVPETNILISAKINTEKTQIAAAKKIPVVTRDWLDENNEFFLNEKKHPLSPFYGLVIYVYGFDNETSVEMKKTISENHGMICKYPKSADVIVIRAGMFLSESDKNYLNSFYDKVVTEKWYEKCLSRRRYYRLDKKDFKMDTDIISTRYKELFSEVDDYSYASGTDIDINTFLGKIFFISSTFDAEARKKLFFAISYCNGIIFDNISPITNYIICASQNEIKTDFINEVQHAPVLLTSEFVFESIKNKEICEYTKYKPTLSLNFTSTSKENDDDIEYEDEYTMITNNKRKKKKPAVSNIFLGSSFTIYEDSYGKELLEEVTEKILENNGTIIKSKKDIFSLPRGKFVILNDGYANVSEALLDVINKEKEKGETGSIILSHRFLDKCIEEKKVLELSDCCTIVPLPFSVPYERFEGTEIYIPEYFYKPTLLREFETLIEILGGKCNFSKNTKYIIVNKELTQREKKKLMQKTNDQVKILMEDWLFELVVLGRLPEEEKFLAKIIN